MAQIKVYYGTKERNVDVTNLFMQLFYKNGQILIPKKISFNNFFGDPVPGIVKNLFIFINTQRYVINEYIGEDIVINLTNQNFGKQIKIIYFAKISSETNWENIICGQLLQLKYCDLINYVQLYVHIVCDLQLSDYIKIILTDIIPNMILTLSDKNNSDIDLISELSNKFPNEIILYFHPKGIENKLVHREELERKLFQELILSWRKIINLFRENESINKIGIALTENGEVAYNFWWARTNYLKTCEFPLISIIKGKIYSDDFYNLIDSNQGKFHTENQILEYLNTIQVDNHIYL